MFVYCVFLFVVFSWFNVVCDSGQIDWNKLLRMLLCDQMLVSRIKDVEFGIIIFM